MEFVECVLLDDSPYEGTESDNNPSTSVTKKRKKPRVIAPWTHEEINCLLSSIKEHQCIWQNTCSDYNDRFKRELAWLKIHEICGHTVDDCKGKWGNLRTAYQNAKKKMKTNSGQGEETTKPHWPHWTAMQFYNRTTTDDGQPEENQQIRVPKLENEKDQEKRIPKLENILSSGADKHDELVQRAVKYLETEEDNWHMIGMYLASQMRELAKTNKQAANKLHIQLVQTVLEAVWEADV